MLSSILNRPIYDRTNLTGNFDIQLEYTPDQMPQIPPGHSATGTHASFPGWPVAQHRAAGATHPGKLGNYAWPVDVPRDRLSRATHARLSASSHVIALGESRLPEARSGARTALRWRYRPHDASCCLTLLVTAARLEAARSSKQVKTRRRLPTRRRCDDQLGR
jgi:hypothetical protein